MWHISEWDERNLNTDETKVVSFPAAHSSSLVYAVLVCSNTNCTLKFGPNPKVEKLLSKRWPKTLADTWTDGHIRKRFSRCSSR